MCEFSEDTDGGGGLAKRMEAHRLSFEGGSLHLENLMSAAVDEVLDLLGLAELVEGGRGEAVVSAQLELDGRPRITQALDEMIGSAAGGTAGSIELGHP